MYMVSCVNSFPFDFHLIFTILSLIPANSKIDTISYIANKNQINVVENNLLHAKGDKCWYKLQYFGTKQIPP